MQTMDWLESHIGSIEQAIEMINKFQWHLSVTHTADSWYVTTGDLEKYVIFSADSRAAVDTFIYGMSLAYGGIPSPIFEQVVEQVQDWYDDL